MFSDLCCCRCRKIELNHIKSIVIIVQHLINKRKQNKTKQNNTIKELRKLKRNNQQKYPKVKRDLN